MKVLFVNPPFVKVNNEFKDMNYNLYYNYDQFLDLVRRLLGKRFMAFIEKFGARKILSTVRYGVRAGGRWPFTLPSLSYIPYPFIMAYAASYIQQFGHEVDIMDCVVNHYFSYSKFIKQLKKAKPDLVVIETAGLSRDIDVWSAEKISEFADVAFAGPFITDEIIKEYQEKYPFIKYYLKGEYILSMKNLVDKMEPGVYESEIVTDLDSLPYPYRDYKGILGYNESSMLTEKPQLWIWGSKGCPFKCSFCMWPQVMYKGKVSVRSPEKIIDEIKYVVDKYGFKSILFDDDTFNLGKERISKLCDYLKELGIPWTCMTRLDCASNELFDKMIASGCIGFRLGVETFNLDVLKRVNKGLERIDFRETLEYLSKQYPDVYIHITMMKDLPGQTEEMHKEDMRIINEMGYVSLTDRYRSYQLSSCVPYPGTKLYEELAKTVDKNILNDQNNFDGFDATIMTKINKTKSCLCENKN